MTRGRRPLPTRLKYLAGNPGKRPLNPYEPRPEPAVPDCPPELGPAAKREWDRLVGDLAKLNMITNLDRAALAAYCGAYALWADATAQIQNFGAMIKSPTGYPVQSPYISIANRQAEIMLRIAAEFGFTPASSSRIELHRVISRRCSILPRSTRNNLLTSSTPTQLELIKSPVVRVTDGARIDSSAIDRFIP